LGYSGHAFVVAEAYQLSGGSIDGYSDREEKKLNPFNLPYLGNESDSHFAFWHASNRFILGIGENTVRLKLAAMVRERGGQCLTVVHPSASVSSSASIGAGTFIARNVAVNPLCQIGANVILNTSCSIDHECVVSEGVHIAPGVVLAGNVEVGKSSFIGANSVVKQGVKIGENVIIGAGSVVLKDVPDYTTAVGNPARMLNQKSK
jgi:acetyltransferase EpsM